MSSYLGLILALVLLFFPAQAKEPPIPRPVGPVNDFANVISPEYEKRLESFLVEVFHRTGVSIIILTMPHISGMDHNEYANLVFNKWGIGRKGEDKGILIFLTIKERKMRIETGYGIEETLPDGLVGEIRDKYMLPYFRKNQFDQGLYEGVKAIAAVLEKKELPLKASEEKEAPQGALPVIFMISMLAITAIIIISMVARTHGQGRYGRYPWGRTYIPIGGGFGGSFGGFGGGFGGFGGGSSGGGGAGGSF